MQGELLQLSWIPIYRARLEGGVAPLAEHVTRLSEASPGVELSNRGGFQSDDLLADFRADPERAAVLAQLEGIVRAFIEDYKRHGQEPGTALHPFDLEICNLWANRNEPGDYNATHHHPGAHVSGVLYAQADEGCGQLLLRPPYSFFDVVLDRSVQPSVVPEPGLVVLFPSDVDHTTEPNRSGRPRISYAFNARYRPVTPDGRTFL